MTVRYFVVADAEHGIAEAETRGWTRIAYARFGTPEKDDVRMIRRFADFVPMPGRIAMFKGADYDSGPPDVPKGRAEQWTKEWVQFEEFVASGGAEWIDP